MRKSLQLLKVCCAVCVFLSSSVAQQKLPLSLEDEAKIAFFTPLSPVALAPDGDWVAYTLTDARGTEEVKDSRYTYFSETGVSSYLVGCEVWVTEISSGQSINLSQGHGSSWTPVWSPDGNYLAFYSDRSGKASLWVWERATRKSHQVSSAIVHPFLGSEKVQWTPDGKSILTKILPENLSLEESINVTRAIPVPEQDQKRVDGSSVTVYRSLATSTERNVSQVRQEQIETPSWTNTHVADLALVDLATGAVRRIANGLRIAGYWLSPDGTNVALTEFKGVKGAARLYNLLVISASKPRLEVRVFGIQQGEGLSVSWSPDGKLLSYTTGSPLYVTGQRLSGDCYIVPAEGGPARNITQSSHPDFSSGFRPPLWDPKGEFIYFLGAGALWRTSVKSGTAAEWSRIPARTITEIVSRGPTGQLWPPGGPGSDAIYVSTRNDETRQMGFYQVELETGKYTRLIEEDKDYGSYSIFNIDVSARLGSFVYVAEDAKHGQDVWLADPGFRNLRRVTNINPQLGQFEMGASRSIVWRSLDGERLSGALLLPADYQKGQRYPLIVCVYGGALPSRQVNRFGAHFAPGLWNFQLLATRGYAVLFPDAPQRIGTPMADLLKTVMPGVDRVIEMGIADPERLGLVGHSYGGYGTLALLVQTNRFKAAVSYAGFGNLMSFYGQMGKDGSSRGIGLAEEGLLPMGGTPWEFRTRYIENSPVFYLDRIQTPLLLIHGAEDAQAPSFGADEIFVGLRRLGKEAEYAKYEGEGHAISNYKNRIDYLSRVLAWFDRWLRK